MTNINLFTPLQLGPYTLPNRVVLAPLTRNRAAEGNVPQAMSVEYYRQRASGGLLITEASPISPQGIGYPATPCIYSDAQITGWKKITDAVHKEGGHIFIQLWHVGRISHPSLQANGEAPVAPSAIKPAGEVVTYAGMQPYVTPRALETDEIAGIINDYAQATRNAKAAGFDGVEIHAANGYLLDQFIRDGTNQRTDQYGGSLENRCRIISEVTEAVIAQWHNDCVSIRLSPENRFNDIEDSNPQTTFDYLAEQLNQYELAYLHVVEGDMMTGDRYMDYRQLRDTYNGLYMANNGYDYERATQALANDDADLLSFGKLYIANPDLPERFKQRAALNEPDADTFYGGDEHGYTDYPPMG